MILLNYFAFMYYIIAFGPHPSNRFSFWPFWWKSLGTPVLDYQSWTGTQETSKKHSSGWNENFAMGHSNLCFHFSNLIEIVSLSAIQ